MTRTQEAEARRAEKLVLARQVEDTVKEYHDSMTDLAKATMWTLQRASGMSTEKAMDIRVKAGAIS